jgi:hypothetical protein
MNSNLQVILQIFNGIQVCALAWQVKDVHIFDLKQFQRCFGCIFGIIVLRSFAL